MYRALAPHLLDPLVLQGIFSRRRVRVENYNVSGSHIEAVEAVRNQHTSEYREGTEPSFNSRQQTRTTLVLHVKPADVGKGVVRDGRRIVRFDGRKSSCFF